jgi:hypothetical protein
MSTYGIFYFKMSAIVHRIDAFPYSSSTNHDFLDTKSNLTKSRQQIYDDCVDEVRSLDPRNDDKPITEFNAQWLVKARQPMDFKHLMTGTDE